MFFARFFYQLDDVLDEFINLCFKDILYFYKNFQYNLGLDF